MKSTTNSLRALGRSMVNAMPEPVADALRQTKRAILNRRPSSEVFREIYVQNGWEGEESPSGPGSSLASTENLRAALPGLIRELGVKTLLDVPCGDAYWISTCLPDGVTYIGGDIVPELVEATRLARPEVGEFRVIDLIRDPLPAADLILVRDCLIHLPNRLVLEALANIKRARITYVLTTTFIDVERNIDIEIGGFRPVNLCASPFELPQPMQLVRENERPGKHMGLWATCEL